MKTDYMYLYGTDKVVKDIVMSLLLFFSIYLLFKYVAAKTVCILLPNTGCITVFCNSVLLIHDSYLLLADSQRSKHNALDHFSY